MRTTAKVLFAAFAVVLLAMPAWAQDSVSPSVDAAINGFESNTHQSFLGLATDWSSHHVVYPKPEPESDIENTIQQDPRYWTQQIRRAEQQAEFSESASQDGWVSDKKKKKTNKKKKTKQAPLSGLWSLNMDSGATVGNEMYPATFTATTSPSCSNATQPDFVVYNTNVAGGTPTTATGSGTFANNISVAGNTVVINGVTLTATGVGTDTFTAQPGNGQTTTIDGVAYKWTTSPCATAPCVVRNASTATDATNLVAAINNTCSGTTQCVVSAANPGATAVIASGTGSSTSQVVVTNTSGATIAWSETAAQTLSPAASITAASTSGTNFPLNSSTITSATNLATAINNNTSTNVTANSGGTSTVTLTGAGAGTDGNVTTTDTMVGFSFGGATLTGGTNAATILAFDNIYTTTCDSFGPTPNPYWSYNTGGTDRTSPVVATDGTQIAFVESVGTTANLVVLKYAAGNGHLGSVALTSTPSYPSCTAPCMIRIPFNGSNDDTNSAPFADQGTLYVGDNKGVLHKFINVFFGGTPSEVTTGGWPVTVGTATQVLSSPVADGNTHNIFVGDNAGNLRYVKDTGSTTGVCSSTSNGGAIPCLGTTNGLASGPTAIALGGTITDGPLLDVTDSKVIWFDAVAGTAGSHFIDNVVQTDEAVTSATDRTVSLNNGANGAYTGFMHTGAFDNTYYTTPASGNLYVCGVDNSGGFFNHPALYRIGFAAGAVMNTTTKNGPLDIATGTSTTPNECSPISEIQTTTAADDDFFVSIQQAGGLTGCTGACLYSFTIVSQAFPGNATAGFQSVAGTNGSTCGISVDNTFSAAGASQVYFTPLGNQACSLFGTGGCATQASQSGLD